MKKLPSDDSQIVKDDIFESFQPLRIKSAPTRRASTRIGAGSVWVELIALGLGTPPPVTPVQRTSSRHCSALHVLYPEDFQKALNRLAFFLF
jgi:hypothetical protein